MAVTGRRAVLGLSAAVLLSWLVGYPLLLTAIEALRGSDGWALGLAAEILQRDSEWLALWRSV